MQLASASGSRTLLLVAALVGATIASAPRAPRARATVVEGRLPMIKLFLDEDPVSGDPIEVDAMTCRAMEELPHTRDIDVNEIDVSDATQLARLTRNLRFEDELIMLCIDARTTHCVMRRRGHGST